MAPSPGAAGCCFDSFCLPPHPDKLYPLKTTQMPLYAVGVVPARRQPQPGRISALAAGGPLTSVYQTTARSSTDSDEEE